MDDPGASAHLDLGEWITTREAAELIGVTPNQVRHLARNDTIKARKFGHVWMINRDSAKAYAASDHRPGPKPEKSSSLN
jgi:excisionase family DNA binding protein